MRNDFIPFNTTICLKAYTGNNLQIEVLSGKSGRCVNANTLPWEQLTLIQYSDGKIISIQSCWDKSTLHVLPSGKCVFANHDHAPCERFECTIDDDGLVIFTSCLTRKVMHCNMDGYAWCMDTVNPNSGRWSVIDPHSNMQVFLTCDLLTPIFSQNKMMGVPFGTTICIKAYTGNNLQNEAMSGRSGRCANVNTLPWEHIVLIKSTKNRVIIQSCWDDRNLQVLPTGKCVFSHRERGLWEHFDMKFDEDGGVYFISCHTKKFMQCDKNGYAWCVNEACLNSERWTIINPKRSSIVPCPPY
jgi:hypothetical protein